MSNNLQVKTVPYFHSRTVREIKQKVVPILKEAGVTRSSIFGSFARGDNGPNSDIDILVDFPEGKGLFEFIGLEQKLEDVLHKKVDLITFNGIKPRIRDRILNEQVPIL